MSTVTADVESHTDELSVIDPATEQVLQQLTCCGRDDFDLALERVQGALKGWRQDLAFRRQALRDCARVLRKRSNLFELGTLLTREQGKPKREALDEVMAAAHWFASIAEIEIPAQSTETSTGAAEIRYEPLGIVGAITAGNFPVFLAASKIASALLAGNVVLLKPSPYTPLSTLKLVELLTEAANADGVVPLPKHVVTVLVGDELLGNWLVESEQIAHISFTGSTAVGKRIMEGASHTLKSVTLELGGNDAAIVADDAAIEEIIEPLFWGAFTNAGQFCTGIKRLYVHESVYGRVVDKLTQLAHEIVVDDGLKPKTQMGPLTHRAHFNRIVELVEQTRNAGATITAGGSPLPRTGYFYPPTIVVDLSEDDALVSQEQFGPVLPVLPYRDCREVVARVNASNFGLGASVWTRDADVAARISDELECGTVWVNQHGILDPMVPFGGHKQSGIGREHGWAGVYELTKTKVVSRRAPPTNDS